MNDKDVWKSVLADIEIAVSEANFLTLFKNTALLSVEENVATIAAPSTMIIDLLQKRFYQIIKKSLSKHAGHEIDILFVPKTIVSQKLGDQGPLFAYEKPKEPIGHLPRVRPDYVFQNLAVSSGNQLAYVSAQTVAKNLGHTYNPLFIYGPVGVGKTHLMQAIANDVYQKTPEKKILYITSEEFTNEVVEAIRANDTGRMKKKFRSLDLLIIDDIQFIAGKDRVQEELFHTFNILIDKTSQIILSSDRPPSDIKKLESRLSSRFSGGLTVDIDPPDFELKSAILLIKAKRFNVDLPMEVAKFLAEKAGETRELEGMLLRLITESSTKGEEITKELAEKILGEKKKEGSLYKPDDIIKQVSLFYNLKPSQLKGQKRNALLVRARQVAMFLLKKEYGMTYSEIGLLIGNRDHTTAMHGVQKIEGLVEKKASVFDDILGITRSLSS